MLEQQKGLESEISAYLDRLLPIIANSTTESVLGWCFGYHLSVSLEANKDERLASPAKQIPFLLSLMLSTPTPEVSHSTTKEEWQEVKALPQRCERVSNYVFNHPRRCPIATVSH
jgi:hypothetical protein